VGSQERLAQVPKVSDAFERGIFISITTWSGREVIGAVCDREQTDLLLDVREPDADSDGYVFVPWSSVEQVKIRNVAQRRVKFLQSQPGITLPPVQEMLFLYEASSELRKEPVHGRTSRCVLHGFSEPGRGFRW
jgi:hypothetical protein